MVAQKGLSVEKEDLGLQVSIVVVGVVAFLLEACVMLLVSRMHRGC